MFGHRRAPAVAVVAATLLAPATAAAHAGDPNIDTLITGTQPALPGVTIAAIQSSIAPALSAVDLANAPLEVLGPDGAPFLRIGPDGAFGNVDSPAFYLSQAPSGETSIPAGLPRLRGQTRWVRISPKPAWAWYDARVPAIATAPAAAQNSTTPTLLARFTIPLRYNGQPATGKGEVEYVPPRAGPVATMTSPMAIAPGVTVALLQGVPPDVYLQNSGPLTVTVEGQQGEPFAQIGPHGVRVNLRSPVHAADLIARGGSAVVKLEGATAPEWETVSPTPTYDWLDPRPRTEPSWRIPLRIGPRTYYITGTLGLKPATTVATLLGQRTHPRRSGNGGVPAWLLAVLGLAVLVAGASMVARGRRS